MRSQDTGLTWSQQVRNELLRYYNKTELCKMAELSAILLLAPETVRYDKEQKIFIYEESGNFTKNRFTERHKTYNIKNSQNLSDDPRISYRDPESKRAFLRGAFIASGSFTDPQKSYQFELITQERRQAEELQGLMTDFGILARIKERRGKYVVYLKEGSAIVDILNVIGAHQALMEFENIRILKEMRESVNRQVNCETANIGKTVAAAVRQMEDIRLIQKETGLEELETPLRMLCVARLKYPEAGLSELGNLMDPPLGKSGVNHRFRKLNRMAEEIRRHHEEGRQEELPGAQSGGK